VLADLATFILVGWLSLKILGKLEEKILRKLDAKFPDAGVCVVFFFLSVVVLASVVVDYFIEGRQRRDWYEINFGFAFVWLALFFGLTYEISYTTQALVPNRARIRNVLTVLFVLGAFALSVLAFWQIFGM
jgi:hypothetical protein